MNPSDAAGVSVGPWLDLLHAEVCWAFARENVRGLVLKGPSIAHWLYTPEEERLSVDVDVLIPPFQWQRGIDVLNKRGFTPTHALTRVGEVAPHSWEMARDDGAPGRHTVDLHRYFPGIELAPETAFELLWQDRELRTLAGVPALYPSKSARLVIIALHVARSPDDPKANEDLRRAIAWADANGWESVIQLAADLDARPAFRAGLELVGDTELVPRLGLSGVSVTSEWALRTSRADRTALRLEELRGIGWADRPVRIAHWMFPSPALMEIRSPGATKSRWSLTLAYVSRLGQGVAHAPRAIKQLRDAKRAR